MDRIDPDLRYIGAGNLTTPFGPLDGARMIGAADYTLGRLDGVLVDPRERQVRYFVVERGWLPRRHYLLSAEAARVEREEKALRVDVDQDELNHLPQIHPNALPAFSDDDLIGAMFFRHASD